MATLGVLAWIGAMAVWAIRRSLVDSTVQAWTTGEGRGGWWLRLGEPDRDEVRRWTVGGVRAGTLMLVAFGMFAWLAALGLNSAALILFVLIFVLSPFAFLFLTPPSD